MDEFDELDAYNGDTEHDMWVVFTTDNQQQRHTGAWLLQNVALQKRLRRMGSQVNLY